MYRMITNPVKDRSELRNIIKAVAHNSSNLSIMKYSDKFILVEEASLQYYKDRLLEGLIDSEKTNASKSLVSNLRDTRKLIEEGAIIERI